MTVDASEPTTPARTFPQLLMWRAESTPEDVAVRQRTRGVWREWTWRELAVTASELGNALMSSGVEAGQAVAFLGGPCLDGLLFILAAQGIGAVPCGLHPWYSAGEVHSVLEQVGATFFLAHSQEFVDTLMAGGELPRLRTVAVADQSGMFGDEYDDVVRWLDVIERGRTRQAQRPEGWRQLVERGRLDDACGIYLRGGDGGTRAAVLTYANVLAGWFKALSGADGLPSAPSKRDRLFHDTPIAHIHGAVFGIFLTLVHGVPSHVPDIHDSFAQARMEVSPTYAVASPRAWEQRVAQTADSVRTSSRVHRAVFKVAMASCGLTVARDGSPRRAPWRRAIAAFGYVAAVRPMLDQWGLLRVRHAFVAGGELPPEVARQWRVWGVEVRDCYGLPETAGVVAVGAPGTAGPHTLRTVIPGVDVTISPDKELLVRGANVATNCWTDGLVPNDRIDAGGWLHTGDAGSVEAGQLIVGARDEDLVVLSDGTTVSPTVVVDALRRSPYVRDAIVVGDGRPYLTALVELDPGQMTVWAARTGHGELNYSGLAEDEGAGQLVKEELEKANGFLVEQGCQRVRRVALLPVEAEPEKPLEVATFQSERRRLLTDRYRNLADGLYDSSSPDIRWLAAEDVHRSGTKALTKVRKEGT